MAREHDEMEMTRPNEGPGGAVAKHGSSLQQAMEHARRIAAQPAANGGVLDPDGAAIWLRFCREAGLDWSN